MVLEGSVVCTKLQIFVYPNTLLILFLNVKLVTILEMEISLFFLIAELKVLKIDFSYILLRLGIV